MMGLCLHSLLALPLALQKDATMWMPRQSSTVAPAMDDLFYVIFYICLFFLVGITIAMLVMVYKYHDKEGGNHNPKPSPHHNFALEVTWSVIPLILVIVIFWVGYKGYLDLRTPPAGAYNINVTAQQWSWAFSYPNGWVDPVLHVPQDTPIELTMASQDVLHALFVPDFRIKQDIVPGRYTKLWFQANQPGEHHLFCAEYCGKDHSIMVSKVIVHEPGGYETWLDNTANDPSNETAVGGEKFYNTRGCKQCHSIDGTTNTGPTWKGLFGHEVKLADGSTVVADENYIRESIIDPQAKVVAGYQPVMPTYKGSIKDKQITGIIEYMKTLAK
jgi:cytochrome c oxidase subunit II